MTRLSCSQCSEGEYVCSTEGGYICKLCTHETDITDFLPHLDDGEMLLLDDDGYLAVESLESEHDYGYYPEN